MITLSVIQLYYLKIISYVELDFLGLEKKTGKKLLKIG